MDRSAWALSFIAAVVAGYAPVTVRGPDGSDFDAAAGAA